MANPQRRVWLIATTTAAVMALSVPPFRAVIEQSMAWHMAFQMPLLVLCGWFILRALPPQRRLPGWDSVNQFGLTGFMAAQVILAYWMLPSSLDRAIVLPLVDAIKLITLVISGLLLADAFKRAPSVLQLFFMGYWVSMMAWLGVYFATTDLRLCNAYSLESQVTTGWGFTAWAAILGTAWLAGVLRNK